jgi:hypothetical protein
MTIRVITNFRRKGTLSIHALSIAFAVLSLVTGFSQTADLGALEKAGVVYKNDLESEVPWSMHYAKIDRSQPGLELIASKASGRVIGLGTLSSQMAAVPAEAGEPLAAINGDFYQTERSTYKGDPRGLMIARGELLSAPTDNACFWMGKDNAPHIGKVVSQFKVTWPDGKTTPFGLNEERSNAAAVLFTPSLGRSTLTRNGRELVLQRGATGPWLPLEIGRTYHARVRDVRETNNTIIAKDALVLSLGPGLLRQVPVVKVGDVIQISTATLPDLSDVKMAIGGGPQLVESGKATPPPKVNTPASNLPYAVRALYERHPRSAIGFNKTHFFFVEVDGRQPELSVGMSLEELSDYLVKIGCTEAMNLDGGASSQLIVGGKVVNRPSSGFERNTATGIVLVRKKIN